MVEDALTLTGLRATAHHGVLEHERVNGQEFVIDLIVWLDTHAAAANDELSMTVHYGVLAREVVDCVERDPVDLIETVAERIAGVALAHPAVLRTRVTLHKPSAPIEVPFDDISITIERARA
ncbi:MAG TPA: dihydroneopterin aldolase [Galbitalea sp.]|jgi:dihydroneopterin aldolase|nr:dihydroneopterin aldolase [Galbitalea sp.]